MLVSATWSHLKGLEQGRCPSELYYMGDNMILSVQDKAKKVRAMHASGSAEGGPGPQAALVQGSKIPIPDPPSEKVVDHHDHDGKALTRLLMRSTHDVFGTFSYLLVCYTFTRSMSQRSLSCSRIPLIAMSRLIVSIYGDDWHRR